MHRLASEGFVLSDGVEVRAVSGGRFVMAGRIDCQGGIYVDVEKYLRVVDGAGAAMRVQTEEYSYNAAIPGLGTILRYDSPHAAEHRPFHHVHRYDVLAWDRHGQVEVVAEDAWPTLGEVLEELREWYHANLERLNSLP
jgi:hypothetical protein